MEADDGDYFIISDTIVTISKVKSSSELVAVIVVVDKIKNDTGFLLNLCPSVAFRPYEPLESFFVRN